jgi:motility quorum-sensing regulator/GCU-specific mRNA interferase toxin
LPASSPKVEACGKRRFLVGKLHRAGHSFPLILNWHHNGAILGVEKRKPNFDLKAFQAVCGDPRRLAITTGALRTATEIGFGRDAIAQVVRAMQSSDFQKSMTSYRDHRRWQDVYQVSSNGMVLYIKFTDDIVTKFVLLSFKEK